MRQRVLRFRIDMGFGVSGFGVLQFSAWGCGSWVWGLREFWGCFRGLRLLRVLRLQV